MAPKVDIFQAFIIIIIIGLVWVNFTVKAFKMAWHIISTSQKERTCEDFKQIVVCEKCQGFFIDYGEELKYGRFLCETCLDKLEKDN